MSANDESPLAELDNPDELATGISNPDNLMNINILRKMDPSLVVVLQAFTLEERVYERFCDSGVRFNQLSSLSRSDLELMGVSDVDTQDKMLSEFASLQGQDTSYSRVFRMHREHQGRQDMEAFERGITVLHMLQNQLQNINTLLAATIIKVQNSRSIDSPGVVLNNRFESHDMVIEMLQKMNFHSQRMLEIISSIQEQPDTRESEDFEKRKKAKLKKVTVGSVLIASGIILGFILVKHLRGGR